MIGYIVKLFRALNSNSKPNEIVHAICIGALLGFLPKGNLLWILVFILFSFIRINKATYFLTLIIVSQFAWRLDSFFSSIGYTILTMKNLESTFAFLLDIPFVGFTKFNNSIVMGSLVFSLAIYIPLYVLIRLFISFYRKVLAPLIIGSKAYKAFLKLPLIKKIAGVAEDLI